MKLFQIEEPASGAADPDAPGAAIGIDACGAEAVVAMSLGGNAAVLPDRDGFERALPVPALAVGDGILPWQELFEGARLRAERALLRPVTHAVVVLAPLPDATAGTHVVAAAEAAGLTVLRLAGTAELASGMAPVLAAAMLAEDLAPRPQP